MVLSKDDREDAKEKAEKILQFAKQESVENINRIQQVLTEPGQMDKEDIDMAMEELTDTIREFKKARRNLRRLKRDV